ncbi:MAG: Smr/MutS family protein [Rhodobacter sp.]|nr:Smr/MutS family protein [Rhodobacter sp.]
MSRKGPRGLTPDEHALWSKVAETAVPLHPARPRPIPEQVEHRSDPPPPDPIQAFQIGEKHTETALPPSRPNSQPVAMDRKAFGQLKRGKLKPEARLDLHGLTLAQAHPALTRFILDAQARGLRLVLVITGKGKQAFDDGPIPVRRGLIKHQVPVWLSQPPLSFAVLQSAEAHFKHGGSGAYYVYLRRNR